MLAVKQQQQKIHSSNRASSFCMEATDTENLCPTLFGSKF